MSHCNACWEPLQGQANLAACGHVFCDAHAEQALDAAEGCPLCGGPLAHNTLKVVPVEPTDAALETALLGLCPDAIAQAAHKAVEWWMKQTEMTYQEFLRQSHEGYAQREERYKAKLSEVHEAYKKAKAKNAQQMEEMQAMGKDRDELRAKFEAKSREKRLLEDKLHALAAENQALKSGGPAAALHHHDAQHEASLAAAAALHPSGHMGAASALLRPQGQHFATHRTMNAGPGGGGGIVTQTRSIHATQHFEYTTTGGGGGSGGGLIGAKRPAAVAGLGVQFQRLGGRSPGNSGGGLLPGGVHRVGTSPVGMPGYHMPQGNPVYHQNAPVPLQQQQQQQQRAHYLPPLSAQHNTRRPGGPSAAPSPRRGLQFGNAVTL